MKSYMIFYGGCLVIGLLILVHFLSKTTEQFAANTSAQLTKVHEKVPPVDPTAVANTKTAIINFIKNRPEFVTVAIDVLSDPQIRPTFHKIIAIGMSKGKSSDSGKSSVMTSLFGSD
jgi:hypothetical protein